MGKKIRDLLEDWPQSFIQTSDLMMLLDRSKNACYSIVKRELKSGLLIHLKRGLYLIVNKIKRRAIDEFELALFMYGPSFVSVESALSYHGWIPEAVYTTTCVSVRRAKEFNTPVGAFTYKRVPTQQFFLGVDRLETKSGAILIASPWRALADLIYTSRKKWKNIGELEKDLRIDKETLINSDIEMLNLLVNNYPSSRVRRSLNRFLKEIQKNYRDVYEH